MRDRAVFYLEAKLRQQTTPSFFFFVGHNTNPLRKALTVRTLNLHVSKRSRKAMTARYNQSTNSIPEKIRTKKSKESKK